MDKTATVLTKYVIVSIPDYSCCLRIFRTALVLVCPYFVVSLFSALLLGAEEGCNL